MIKGDKRPEPGYPLSVYKTGSETKFLARTGDYMSASSVFSLQFNFQMLKSIIVIFHRIFDEPFQIQFDVERNKKTTRTNNERRSSVANSMIVISLFLQNLYLTYYTPNNLNKRTLKLGSVFKECKLRSVILIFVGYRILFSTLVVKWVLQKFVLALPN